MVKKADGWEKDDGTEVDNAVREVIERGNMSTFNCPEEVYLAEELIKIHSELMSKFEKLSFSDAEFIHPYAHPKNPGKGRDHFGR